MKYFPLAAMITVIALFATSSHAREQIRIVGSSTVYPFVSVAAEEFGDVGDYKTPIVESTGTGGGFKLFCSGVGDKFPDFSNASREIKASEIKRCAKNGITDITEIKIGYDGIVIAGSVNAKRYHLSKTQVFLALANKVPSRGKLVDNPYQKWSDIDSSLPNVKIEVYGPPPTSGTRDAFVELVMEKSCKDLPEFLAAYPDKKARKNACHLLREDGRYIDAGENDNLIVQKLNSNNDALGVFGFSFLEENTSHVQGSIIDGVEPSFDNISSGEYSVSRSLFVYAKNIHAKSIKGFAEFAEELVSDTAIGEDGYLLDKGLIPLANKDLLNSQKAVKGLFN